MCCASSDLGGNSYTRSELLQVCRDSTGGCGGVEGANAGHDGSRIAHSYGYQRRYRDNAQPSTDSSADSNSLDDLLNEFLVNEAEYRCFYERSWTC